MIGDCVTNCTAYHNLIPGPYWGQNVAIDSLMTDVDSYKHDEGAPCELGKAKEF